MCNTMSSLTRPYNKLSRLSMRFACHLRSWVHKRVIEVDSDDDDDDNNNSHEGVTWYVQFFWFRLCALDVDVGKTPLFPRNSSAGKQQHHLQIRVPWPVGRSMIISSSAAGEISSIQLTCRWRIIIRWRSDQWTNDRLRVLSGKWFSSSTVKVTSFYGPGGCIEQLPIFVIIPRECEYCDSPGFSN